MIQLNSVKFYQLLDLQKINFQSECFFLEKIMYLVLAVFIVNQFAWNQPSIIHKF